MAERSNTARAPAGAPGGRGNGDAPQPLAAGEPWADAAVADLARLDAGAREAWHALFDHARECNASKASAKWTERAGRLLESVGRESFVAHVDRWFACVATRGAVGKQVVHRGDTYNNVPSGMSQRSLAGLAWAAAVTRHPLAARVLADLAEVSFRPIPRFGPRCEHVGNAAARALARVGTPEAVGQLARLELRVRTPKGRRLVKKLLAEAIEA